MIRIRILFYILFLLPFAAFAQGPQRQSVVIDAKCNVYYNNLMHPHDRIPGGSGIPPIEIDVRGIKAIWLDSVSGTVSFEPWNDSVKASTADGSGPLTTSVVESKGFSGVTHSAKAMFLVGVFVNKYIVSETTPETLDFSKYENYTNWGPNLNQVFFIGDGKDSKTRQQQIILVPTDAEKLYLGFADGLHGLPSNYGDNSGSIKATVVWGVKPPSKN